MREQLLALVILCFSGIFVMIIHELPKTIVYYIRNKNRKKGDLKKVFRLYQYIDPIGMIFTIAAGCCFSKPYMYRIKEKKTNLILGITGFSSLAVLFFCCCVGLRMLLESGLALSLDNVSNAAVSILTIFLLNLASLSLSMFLLNLFPISTFDLGLIIAAKSPSKYFSIIRNDSTIKVIMLLCILFGLVKRINDMLLALMIR